MKDPKPIAETLLSSRPSSADAIVAARDRARAYLASTLLELGRGSSQDPVDVQLAEQWAELLVETIADYAAIKMSAREGGQES